MIERISIESVELPSNIQNTKSFEKVRKYAEGLNQSEFLFKWEAAFPSSLCSIGPLGIYLGQTFDQNSLNVNGILVGAQGNPIDSRRIQSLWHSSYPLPQGIIKCPGLNSFELRVSRKLEGGFLGPRGAPIWVGNLTQFQELSQAREAGGPFLKRDFSLFLIAIVTVYLALFWGYSKEPIRKNFAYFALAGALSCLASSAWLGVFVSIPSFSYRLAAVLYAYQILAMNIFVVPVYRNSLLEIVRGSEILAKNVSVKMAINSSQALKFIVESEISLVIMDIDLGPDSLSGIEVAKKMREQNFAGRISIHSNRFLADDTSLFLESGANSTLPKPMSKIHLLKLILGAAKMSGNGLELKNDLVPESLPEFAVLDDSSLVRRSWVRKSKGTALVRTFESPELFWIDVEANPTRLSSYKFVVTDFLFDDASSQNGFEFAKKLRIKYAGPIILSTNGELTLPTNDNPINFLIEKDAYTVDEMMNLITLREHKHV